MIPVGQTILEDKPCICIPFTSNNNFHNAESDIVGLYLYFTDGVTKFINFTHPDAREDDISLVDIKLHPN